MGILFLIALFLAWPTGGLSILAWIAVVVFNAHNKTQRVNHREERAVFLEPLFDDVFQNFSKRSTFQLYEDAGWMKQMPTKPVVIS